jgi:hypothetical protein
MKINMGCGQNKLEGFLNVDKFAECAPDLQVDLEVFPWPLESDSSEEIIFNFNNEGVSYVIIDTLGNKKYLEIIIQEGNKTEFNSKTIY